MMTYTKLITDLLINEIENTRQTNPSLRWELLKYHVRVATLDYCKTKARERRRQDFELLKDISQSEGILSIISVRTL